MVEHDPSNNQYQVIRLSENTDGS